MCGNGNVGEQLGAGGARPSVVSQDIKVVMLGESNVGKTCICARFVQGRFPTDTTMTIGATYSTKIISVQAEAARSAGRGAR